MNLIKAYEYAIQNGGVTYNLNTGEMNPNYGYMVATEGREESHSSLSLDVISDYCKRHSEVLADPQKYLGIWYYLENDIGHWVLDVSEIFEEKRNAIFFGIVRKQQAIWDNMKNKSYFIW